MRVLFFADRRLEGYGSLSDLACLPHFLDVPVGHKTGDSGVIANDVGIVYARSGPIVIAFFTNGITGPYAETEDRIGRVARLIVDYFQAATSNP